MYLATLINSQKIFRLTICQHITINISQPFDQLLFS